MRYSRLSCVGSITSSYFLSPHKKFIGWADGVKITSRRYYGRRKPLKISFFLFENCNIIMEGSIFLILPLSFLIILGLPAIVPNFTGRLHLDLEKSVQI